jgi:ribosomal protein S18 acetylase RimI-like enzyme
MPTKRGNEAARSGYPAGPDAVEESASAALFALVAEAGGIGFVRDSDSSTPLKLRRSLIVDDVLDFNSAIEESINEFQGPKGLSKCLMTNMFILRWCSRSGAIKALLTFALSDGTQYGLPHKAGDICITIHPDYTRRGLATMMLDDTLKGLPVWLERQTYSAAGANFIAGYLERKSMPFEMQYETPDEYCARCSDPTDAGHKAILDVTYDWLKRNPGPHTASEMHTAIAAGLAEGRIARLVPINE